MPTWEVYEDRLCTVPWAVARNGQIKARFMCRRKARDYAAKQRLLDMERPSRTA